MTRYRWIHARKAEGYELRWVDWRLWGDLPSVESIYLYEPDSPWQRGSNENTNGLRLPFMPKGTDLSQPTPADLLRIQRILSGRQRVPLLFVAQKENRRARCADL